MVSDTELKITKDFSGTSPIYNDSYQIAGSLRGLFLVVTQEQTVTPSGNIDEIVVKLSTTSSGDTGILRYSLDYFE